jgi:hypothetical protein
VATRVVGDVGGGGLSVETCMGNREVLCGQQSEHIAAQMATHRGEVTVGFGQTLPERRQKRQLMVAT